jgi:hypothetical protein
MLILTIIITDVIYISKSSDASETTLIEGGLLNRNNVMYIPYKVNCNELNSSRNKNLNLL